MKIRFFLLLALFIWHNTYAQTEDSKKISATDNTDCNISEEICINSKDKTVKISWEDYFLKKDDNAKKLPFLQKIEKVKQNDRGITLYGYLPREDIREKYHKKFRCAYGELSSEDLYAVTVEPKRGNNFVLTEKFLSKPNKEWAKNFFKSASIMTIPYKIRSGGDDLDRITTSGLKNVAVNFDIMRYRKEIYYPNGKKLKFRFSIGAMVSPTVEEFTNAQRKMGSFNIMEEASDDEQKELFLSTGLTINFSFNDIAFSIIPAGYDFGTTTVGNSWNYEGKHWWGFGIGLSPKFIGPASSK